MHKRIENLLQETTRNICVQYLFSSFNSDLEFAVRYSIAAWLKNCHCGPDPQSSEQNTCHSPSPEQTISYWFEKGKPLKEAFFENLHLNMDKPDIGTEFKKHESWKEKTQLRTTPTILVNGYKLPDNYKIEDLRYFAEFKI